MNTAVCNFNEWTILFIDTLYISTLSLTHNNFLSGKNCTIYTFYYFVYRFISGMRYCKCICIYCQVYIFFYFSVNLHINAWWCFYWEKIHLMMSCHNRLRYSVCHLFYFLCLKRTNLFHSFMYGKFLSNWQKCGSHKYVDKSCTLILQRTSE